MNELEGNHEPMTPKSHIADESMLTPSQREALAIAKTQGKKPIESLRQLKLDIEPEELEEFAKTLDEIRRDSRGEKAKDWVE